MPAKITNKFRILNAKNFISGITDPDSGGALKPVNNLYAFIGRPQPWGTSYDSSGSDTIPSTPGNNFKEEIQSFTDIMSVKRVYQTDVTHGIRKVVWTSGSYYDIYRHDYDGIVQGVNITNGSATTPSDLSQANYYVITDNYNVYICLSNNGGAASTISPQQLTYDSFGISPDGSADGYRWKYIAATSANDVVSFSTTDFHPVKTLTSSPLSGDAYYNQYQSQTGARSKGVYSVVVYSNGSSYTAGTTYVFNTGTSTWDGTTQTWTLIANAGIKLEVRGDGTGFACSITMDGSGHVAKVVVLDPGIGFNYLKLNFIHTTGSGATFIPILSQAGGLGSDPIRDLSAYYIITHFQFAYDDGAGDFPIGNDYRRVGLMYNPKTWNSSTLFESATGSAYWTLNTGNSSAFAADDVITETTSHAAGRVVAFDPSTGVTKVIRTVTENTASTAGSAIGSASFGAGHVVTNGSQSNTISSVVTPEVDPAAGEIIYLENRTAINRAIDQVEDFRVVIEF